MRSPDYILDQQTTAVMAVSADLEILYLNQAAEALVEASGHRLLGEPLVRVFSDPATPPATFKEALTRRAGVHETRRHARASISGATVSVDYTVTPMLDRTPPSC